MDRVLCHVPDARSFRKSMNPRIRFVCFANISLRHVSFCCVGLSALFERGGAIMHHVAVGFFLAKTEI